MRHIRLGRNCLKKIMIMLDCSELLSLSLSLAPSFSLLLPLSLSLSLPHFSHLSVQPLSLSPALSLLSPLYLSQTCTANGSSKPVWREKKITQAKTPAQSEPQSAVWYIKISPGKIRSATCKHTKMILHPRCVASAANYFPQNLFSYWPHACFKSTNDKPAMNCA